MEAGSTLSTRGVRGRGVSRPASPSVHTMNAGGFFSDIALRVRDHSITAYGESRPIEMIGRSDCYVDALRKIEKVASFQEPVLIVGESGVGKESLAQAIHLLGNRRSKPMVSVNCPQYREGNLTVSELFGHRRGSFTGATADRQGCFESANGGVIFLDEIGDLHMSAQVMLLRALATGEFQPLGADYTRTVNVRVVAATNRPLDRLMIGEEFRHDLFYRLQYFLIKVPPLRERGDDWKLLLDYFLASLHRKYGVEKRFDADSMRILETYDWPGNVRELLGVTTAAYAMSDGSLIRPDDFVNSLSRSIAPTASSQGADPTDELHLRMSQGGESFWDVVHKPFIERELSRRDVRRIIEAGLRETRGSYRHLLELYRMRQDDYQKFMDFLRHHRLKPDA